MKLMNKICLFAVVGFMALGCQLAHAADSADKVFLDEGDGDFDSVPTVPKGKAKAKAAKAAAPAPRQPEETASTQVSEQTTEAATTSEAAPMPEPVAEETQPATPQVEKKAVLPKKAMKVSAKTPKVRARVPASSSRSAGLYVKTLSACPMTREPASESDPMLTVKPAKRIWVEKVEGGQWYRAFNKAGEPGYIASDCASVTK